jgi:hypothetical protein
VKYFFFFHQQNFITIANNRNPKFKECNTEEDKVTIPDATTAGPSGTPTSVVGNRQSCAFSPPNVLKQYIFFQRNKKHRMTACRPEL